MTVSGVSGSNGDELIELRLQRQIFLILDRLFYVDVYPEFPEIQTACMHLVSGLGSPTQLLFPEFPEVAVCHPGDLLGIVKGCAAKKE